MDIYFDENSCIRFDKKYILVDKSHPLFNLWKCKIANGESYMETFRKGINPNNKSKEN